MGVTTAQTRPGGFWSEGRRVFGPHGYSHSTVMLSFMSRIIGQRGTISSKVRRRGGAGWEAECSGKVYIRRSCASQAILLHELLLCSQHVKFCNRNEPARSGNGWGPPSKEWGGGFQKHLQQSIKAHEPGKLHTQHRKPRLALPQTPRDQDTGHSESTSAFQESSPRSPCLLVRAGDEALRVDRRHSQPRPPSPEVSAGDSLRSRH